jgi:hypothetical protein
MKKILVLVLLVPLALAEIYFCTAFLPFEWQRAINNKLPQILPNPPDQTLITHPNLDLEVEQVMREHIWVRLGLYCLTIVLMLANALLMRRLWRFGYEEKTASVD